MKTESYNGRSTDEELSNLCLEACQNLDPEMILFDAKCAVYDRLSSKMDGLVSFPVFSPLAYRN